MLTDVTTGAMCVTADMQLFKVVARAFLTKKEGSTLLLFH